VWEEIYRRLAALIERHRTTLVFVNTRRLAERVTRHLAERIGEENVTSHHGSLSREHRLDAEHRLKAGSLRALVATARRVQDDPRVENVLLTIRDGMLLARRL